MFCKLPGSKSVKSTQDRHYFGYGILPVMIALMMGGILLAGGLMISPAQAKNTLISSVAEQKQGRHKKSLKHKKISRHKKSRGKHRKKNASKKNAVKKKADKKNTGQKNAARAARKTRRPSASGKTARRHKARLKRSKRMVRSNAGRQLKGRTGRAGLENFKRTLNRNTVTLMTGRSASGTYSAFGADIKDMIARVAALVPARMDGKGADGKGGKGQQENRLRVLPVMGGGAGDNLRDLLYLRGVDMAILNSDVIAYYQDEPLYGDLAHRIRYIARLFNEEIHLFASRDGTVSHLRDIEGKRLGVVGSGARITSLILLKKLGIKPAAIENFTEGDGAQALAEGRIGALLVLSGKPMASIGRMLAVNPSLKLVPIEFDPVFISSYLPAGLGHKDYPALIERGFRVPTLAVRTFLAVFDWPANSPRYNRLARFTRLFLGSMEQLRRSKNLHPKWREVNIEASIPGLERFEPARKWLEARKQPQLVVSSGEQAGTAGGNDGLIRKFRRFMAMRQKSRRKVRPQDAEKLFAEFLRWRESSPPQQR